jgi:SlyX protein
MTPTPDFVEPALNERIVDLEIKISFMQDLLETLNRQVYEQQRQLDQMTKAVQVLRDQGSTNGNASRLDPAGGFTYPAAERPPHY